MRAALSFSRQENDGRGWLTPFLAGVLATGAGWVVSHALATRRRRGFDPRLIRSSRDGAGELTPVVVVPGIMGSGLCRPDGTRVWLNLRNAIGHFNLSLPFTLPLAEGKRRPGAGGAAGGHRRPRSAHVRLHRVLRPHRGAGGGRASVPGGHDGAAKSRPTTSSRYDWRRDLVEAARRLQRWLERLADERGDPDGRASTSSATAWAAWWRGTTCATARPSRPTTSR